MPSLSLNAQSLFDDLEFLEEFDHFFGDLLYEAHERDPCFLASGTDFLFNSASSIQLFTFVLNVKTLLSTWVNTLHQLPIHLMATSNYISCAYLSITWTSHPLALLSPKQPQNFLVNIKDHQRPLVLAWVLWFGVAGMSNFPTNIG